MASTHGPLHLRVGTGPPAASAPHFPPELAGHADLWRAVPPGPLRLCSGTLPAQVTTWQVTKQGCRGPSLFPRSLVPMEETEGHTRWDYEPRGIGGKVFWF